MNQGILFFVTVLFLFAFGGCREEAAMVQRPEKVVSKREVVYDTETYKKLAGLWKEYYREFPSEDAYANWMYATRYAGAEDYEPLLKRGVSRYPANPVLLYLSAMVRHGASDNIEAQELLERSSSLDPTYMDPWFGLVIHYLEQRDKEKTNFALRKLLEAGAVENEIMDYSYNMIASLDKNAILVTNGDNDTYPGWILTRVLEFRPDVRIVNRALLNTEWYPLSVIAEGVPSFVDQPALETLRKRIWGDIKEGRSTMPPAGPFADALIERLIEAGSRTGRPVYFAATLMPSEVVDRWKNSGSGLGLVTLVTPLQESRRSQFRRVYGIWLAQFRTGGMDAWDLHHAQQARAGKRLMFNYAAAFEQQMDEIISYAPDYRAGLFRWYLDHVMAFVPDDYREKVHRAWCRSGDIREIRNWCRSMNLNY